MSWRAAIEEASKQREKLSASQYLFAYRDRPEAVLRPYENTPEAAASNIVRHQQSTWPCKCGEIV